MTKRDKRINKNNKKIQKKKIRKKKIRKKKMLKKNKIHKKIKKRQNTIGVLK